jgi:hypothetical protein
MAEQLPLPLKKNIRDFEPKMVENLRRIKEASGVEYALEIKPGFGVINDKVTVPHQKNRTAEILYTGMLDSIARMFTEQCEDSMVKEALVEATSGKKIILEMCDDISPNMPGIGMKQQILFADGCLVVKFKAEHIWTNTTNLVPFKFETLL